MYIKYIGGYSDFDPLTIGRIYEVVSERKSPYSGADCYQVINDQGEPWYVRKPFCIVVEDQKGIKVSW